MMKKLDIILLLYIANVYIGTYQSPELIEDIGLGKIIFSGMGRLRHFETPVQHRS